MVSAFGAFAGTDSALMALLPASTKLISSVDVERARSSPFGQFLLARMNSEDQSLQTFLAETGFDPRRDLQYVVFGVSGPSGAGRTVAFLLRGNFDQDRIAATAQSKGINTTTVDGVVVYVDVKRPNQTGFTFPELGVVAIGDLGTLTQVIQNRANPSTLDSNLQQLANQVSVGNDAWFASVIPAPPVSSPAGLNLPSAVAGGQILQSIRESSGGAQFGPSVRLSFNAVTRSAQDAVALSDVLRFLASTVVIQQNKDPRASLLSPALSTMTLSTNGSTLQASLNLPEQSVEQLAALGPSKHHFSVTK